MGPGPPLGHESSNSTTHNNDKTAKNFADTTHVMGKVTGDRTWQQILSDSKEKRNIMIIEIHMNNNKTDLNNQLEGNILFIFEVLKIKDCEGILTTLPTSMT